jgi:hypothetical protein
MYRANGRLDRELIDWRAGALISELYQEVYKHLEDNPVAETIRVLERLHSMRSAVHGVSPGMEPVHPDGLWTDLGQLCEQAGWELSRLQLAWTRVRKVQEPRREEIGVRTIQQPRREDTGVRSVQEPRREDLTVRKAQDQRQEEMGGIADQTFGETDL